ncbi:glycosyltransferase [Fusobacterium varium]|uniref:glycosyltransferase n=1 Tax=Fusobacterium varium TaxID=856 RepID=UPI000E54C0B5|nr:glycosyltransferase [Fusobacterium varium]RHG36866.1 glycosyltransferase [Fusobacterium varium]
MENKTIELSIIVPIYNVEKYLRQCLDSIYKIENIKKEIILVNDGTKDNSGEIINEYYKKYKEITKVIEQENSGLSSARNTGLKNAMGKYIYFIDSDDYLDNEKFEILFSNVNTKDLDILVGGLNFFYEDTNKIIENKYNKKLFRDNEITGLEFLEESVKLKSFNVSVWTNIYKREFLLNNNNFFKEKLLHEDYIFTLKAFCQARKVWISDNNFYFYRKRSGSITSNLNLKNFIHLCYTLNYLLDYIKKENINNIGLNEILCSLYLKIIIKGKIYSFSLLKKLMNYTYSKNIKIEFKILVSFVISIFRKFYNGRNLENENFNNWGL